MEASLFPSSGMGIAAEHNARCEIQFQPFLGHLDGIGAYGSNHLAHRRITKVISDAFRVSDYPHHR